MQAESAFKRISEAAGIAVGFTGLLVLTGWLLDIPALKSVLPQFVTMKANTALCFVFIGLALWLLQEKRADSRPGRRLARIFAGLVFLTGFLTFLEYAGKWDLGIDQLLFKEPASAILTSSPGRMAFNTTILFMASGAALLALSLETLIACYLTQCLGIFVSVAALLSFVGYIYGAAPLFLGPHFSTAMALHTTAAFQLAAAGCLFARPGLALMAVVSSGSYGGWIARRTLPIVILLPFVLGWLKLHAETTTWFGPDFGVVLVALANMLVVSVSVYLLSAHLNRLDARRKKAEENLNNIQRLESLGHLAGGLAHDFNNLLMGVTANLSLIARKTGDDPELKELLSETEAAADKAIALSGRLLTFAKGGDPVRKTLDLGKVLPEEVNFSARGSNCRCDIKTNGEPLLVLADKDQFSQVITNIVRNGIQAMPGGGVLGVKAESCAIDGTSGLPLEKGNYIRVSFSDSGGGIPERDFGKIFEPYFTTRPGGHGLGLSIAYSILSKHGGAITVKSGIGKGSVFTVYLPAATAKDVPETAKIAPPAQGPDRVLVMDDEEIVQRVTARMLKALGYECVIAPAGAEALEAYKTAAAENRPFSAVIMDLTIPGGMGGAEAVVKLKEIDPKACVIVSSGYSDDPIMSDYGKYGFYGALGKPYKLEALSNALSALKKQRSSSL